MFFLQGENEHLMWCEDAVHCILSIFLSLDLCILSLIATGLFLLCYLYIFCHQKRINKYRPWGQTCLFNIQTSLLLNRYMKYSNNNYLSSKCNRFREDFFFFSRLNRYLNSCCLNCIFGNNENCIDFKLYFLFFCNSRLILLELILSALRPWNTKTTSQN